MTEQGYTADMNYVKSVFTELSPAYINYLSALAGRGTPDLDAPFTYAELGSGFGVTVAGWAAQYPQGTFFSIDFNKAHMEWAAKLAERAGLDNLKCYPRSFAQMLTEDLPPLDYIVLHGVYSWVSDAVRDEIMAVIRKFLKPQGIVYVSYNAKPGWSMLEPMRHFLHASSAWLNQNETRSENIRKGLAFLDELRQGSAVYFQSVPVAAERLSAWMKSEDAYLEAEFPGGEARAFYFSEIHDRMTFAGLRYAGPHKPGAYLLESVTPPPLRDHLLAAGNDPVRRETVSDLIRNTLFRRDLFTMDAKAEEESASMHTLRPDDILDQQTFVWGGADVFSLEQVNLEGASIALAPALYEPVMTLFMNGPQQVATLAAKTGIPVAAVRQAVLVLLSLAWIQPGPREVDPRRILRFNLALEEQLAGEGYDALLGERGGWHSFGVLECVYLLALLRNMEPEAYIAELLARGHLKKLENSILSENGNLRISASHWKSMEERLPALARSLWPGHFQHTL